MDEKKPTKKELKEQRKQENIEMVLKKEKRKLIKNILLWLGFILFIICSVIFLLFAVNKTTPSRLEMPKILANDITRGKKDAQVSFVEYSDFQCPACGTYFPIVEKLYAEYKDKVLFVYRFFPLTTIHPFALSASKASYAAHLQGKFWEMHDMLFTKQSEWTKSQDPDLEFDLYAKTLNLDMTKFKKDKNAKETETFITNQIQAGINAGINATPTFFINGESVSNPNGYEGLKKLLEEELK